MASLLSILKNIISLNRVHAEKQEFFTEALIKTAWGITMKADCIPSFISQVRDLHTPGSAPLDNSSR